MSDKSQNTLTEHLKSKILNSGPISLEDYMNICLSDPEHGYYTNKDPLGKEGDFITSPEISQIFGELIGLWSCEIWNSMQQPSNIHLVELGPGRGTLMADALRAIKIIPEYYKAIHIHFLETSPVLKSLQKEKLSPLDINVSWHEEISTLPEGPKILIANEFFDALPIKQFQQIGENWFERYIDLNPEITSENKSIFNFTLSSSSVSEANNICKQLRINQNKVSKEESENIFEYRVNCIKLIQKIANQEKNFPLSLLIIDYGHAESGFGDTLQAVKNHQYFNPLIEPGNADLTTQVDFDQLKKSAENCNLICYGPIPQGQFLLMLGLQERLNSLLKKNNSSQYEQLKTGTLRLVDPNQMGLLFKVMVIMSKDLPTPFPFNAYNDT